ncbi:MAG TPA: alpha/beta fold hydrolase [Ktedonobacteraceae bacterium]
MTLDIEIYRRTISIPIGRQTQKHRRISVIDIHPENAAATLVFVHGYGGSAAQWLYQLRFFGQTMRVIAPDIRGHGLSDDPEELPLSLDSLVDDLELVLDRMDVHVPFILLAHSFGGAIATEYTLRYPEQISGLVLIGVPTRFIIRPVLSRLINIPDPIFSWAAKKIRVALFAPQRTLKRMLHGVMAPWRGDERLQLLRVPTLVILGHRDTVFLRQDYEAVPRSIPGSQNVVIPVSAHLVQLERPDAVNRVIRRFVNAVGVQPIAHNSHAAQHSEMLWLQYYDNEVPHQVPQPKQPLQDLLTNTAYSFPRRAALIFFGQKISYRELDHQSNRFAHVLQTKGIKKGDRVALVLPNIPQYFIAFFGALKAGATIVLGSPLSNEDEIAYQLEHSGAYILVTLASYRHRIKHICSGTLIRDVIYTDVREYLPVRQRVLIASLLEDNRAGLHNSQTTSQEHQSKTQLKTTLREEQFQQLLRRQPGTPVYPPLEGIPAFQDLALIQYTSGTTDTPKGVMLSHGNLMVNVSQVRHWMPDARRGREIVLCVLPLSHIYGLTDCMNLPFALAGSIVLLPTTRTSEILTAIKQHHPTIFPGIPALYLAIANHRRVRSYGVASIRTCISGSAPLPIEVQEAFEKLTRGRLVEGYGLTEASPATHCNPLKGERRVGSIGIPLPGTSARIVDVRTGEVLPPDEVGELLIRGPQVMQGYWNMPAETREALQDGWLRTGDLASMDEDGYFTIVDRKKDLILAGSYNVYPRDVEEVLYEHPKVLEAAVISTPAPVATNDRNEETTATISPFIKAVVVLKRGEKATAAELLAFCRERLDAYKVPRQIEFRSELPKNFVGKVLRRLLVES